MPFCLAEFKFSGHHSCDDYEIPRYKSEIDDYIGKLQTYVNDAFEAASEASSYAKEVESYAKCEVEEVSSQHK